MKKCKNPKCEKELIGTHASRKYCDNNNKCKNDYSNGMRTLKVAIADGLLANLELRKVYKDILSELLGSKRKVKLPISHLNLMGINLSSPLFNPETSPLNKSHSCIQFDKFSIDFNTDYNEAVIAVIDAD